MWGTGEYDVSGSLGGLGGGGTWQEGAGRFVGGVSGRWLCGKLLLWVPASRLAGLRLPLPGRGLRRARSPAIISELGRTEVKRMVLGWGGLPFSLGRPPAWTRLVGVGDVHRLSLGPAAV